jgi:hypothetical protein
MMTDWRAKAFKPGSRKSSAAFGLDSQYKFVIMEDGAPASEAGGFFSILLFYTTCPKLSENGKTSDKPKLRKPQYRRVLDALG